MNFFPLPLRERVPEGRERDVQNHAHPSNFDELSGCDAVLAPDVVVNNLSAQANNLSIADPVLFGMASAKVTVSRLARGGRYLLVGL